MKANKRTVWLLTLLSLGAVITVFFLTDSTRNISLQTLFTNDSLNEAQLGILEGDSIPVTTDNHLFNQMRMELSNERSQLRQQYLAKIQSEHISAEEKNETFNLLNYLIEQESDEAMAEMQIKALGYADAFVKVEQDKINVTVMADELSKEKINEIVYMLKKDINESALVTVSVKSEYY